MSSWRWYALTLSDSYRYSADTVRTQEMRMPFPHTLDTYTYTIYKQCMDANNARINAVPHCTRAHHAHIWALISWFLCICSVTSVLLTAAYYKTTTPAHLHLFPPFHNLWLVLQQHYARGESVKMAVLIRWRIRAVVFNQSSQWQSLWCSGGDCDDDICWRGKHWKYTCTMICSLWSWAYSAMCCAESSILGEKVVGRKDRGF